jgi:GT2 family glycosyltransferase
VPFEKIKLSIIVLLYHGERWIDSCIGSIENQSLSQDKYEIIMVDNGGTTPSIKNYKNRNNTKIISYRSNLGFAQGNNKALEHARGDIVLLLNQDVVIHFYCLEKILDAFDSHPEAGVVAASMLMVSEKDEIDLSTSIPKRAGFFQLTQYGFARYYLKEPHSKIFPVDFVSGNGLGFRKVILKDLNHYLFDTRLFSYAEDLDFSLRVARTKWKMVVHSGAVLYHFRDEAFAGNPVQRLRKLIRISSNRLLVHANHLNLKEFLRKLPSLVFGIPAKVSRLDGETHSSLFRFIIAFMIVPFVLLHFVLRIPGEK